MIEVISKAPTSIHLAFTPDVSFECKLRNITCGLKSCLQKRCVALCSISDNPKWSSNGHMPNDGHSKYRNHHKNYSSEEEEEERKVHCEVQVISWRERRIKAEVVVNADVASVWDALTDYERLADFVPNLVSSMRIPCPHPGRIWLEQRGLQRALYWHIEARVVLDLQEFQTSANDHELQFSMVDGDFKKFEGKWSVKSGKRFSKTTLSYELNVIPTFNFPAIFLERIISSDLPVNLQAMACRAESTFKNSQNSLTDEAPPVTTLADSFTSTSSDVSGVASDKNDFPTGELKEKLLKATLSPLSPAKSELSSNWGVFGKVCKLDKPCMVDEVHLRRFDGLLENGGVHRCVIASITVKAPVPEVWNILTEYERLPEIVPNLAISKILSRENNKVRILQEGCKGLLYMVLHARVILDLCEVLEQEISFKQVEGDFDSFRGKWSLEQLGNHHTLLKYTVESKMRKNSFLSEAIMEEVIYEDLPSNLCAIRDYIETKVAENTSKAFDYSAYTNELFASSSNENSASYDEPANQNLSSTASDSSRQRPKVPGLQRDIEVLKSELFTFIAEHGQEGFMPMRKQLRRHGRVDIEKAITRMGGFRRIAALMNLSLAYKHRKPKGYWDNLENLQEEISWFQKSWRMDPSFMPSRKAFEQAGRFDIARALEKWGGLHEVSRLLSLKVRHPNRQASLAKERKMEVLAPNEDQAPSKPYVSQNTQKWLTKVKEFDINWVE
nr:uncharacterized protein LOC113719094 isoform X1 [Coffea arabica]